MTFEWTGWLRSVVGLFFVVGIVEAILPPKNAAIKQILALLILIGIFTPFLHAEDLILKEEFSVKMEQSYAGQYENQFYDQVLRETRKEIANRIHILYKEQTGQEPYAVDVKLELSKENQLTVLEVSLVIKEELDSYNKDKICKRWRKNSEYKKLKLTR
jgi:hypothetical protein